jgi:hypothetical protein
MLECSDITVEFRELPKSDWHAVAAIDVSGSYYIFVDSELKNKSEKFMRQLMAHEIAHLIVYDIDSENTSHFGLYEEVCAELVQLAEVKGRHTCKPYSKPPPYPWKPLRRE